MKTPTAIDLRASRNRPRRFIRLGRFMAFHALRRRGFIREMAFVAGYAGYAQFYREFFRGLKISPIQERPSRNDPSQRSPKESGASSGPSAKKSAARFRGSRPAGNYSGRSRDFNNWPCRTEIRRRPAIQPISRTLLTPMKNDREYSMPKATLWAKVSAVVHVFIVFLGVVVGRESRDRGPGMRCDRNPC